MGGSTVIGFLIFAIIIVTAVALGARHYNKNILPLKQLIAFLNNMFKEMNFQTSGRYPHFIGHEYIFDNYIKVYMFSTYCPLSVWLDKKEYFEMHLNEKVLDIKQDENRKRMISIHIENKSLPTMLEWDDWYLNKIDRFAIGISHYGIIVMDLDRDPHAFIAGETGSGKSNILKYLIHQALYKEYNVELIDFKRGVSFSEFSDRVTVHYEYPDVIKVLERLIAETSNRLDKFRAVGVDNIHDYNDKVSGDYLKRTILFIDELAELLRTSDKEISKTLNSYLETLTRLSRAVGINLIMGLQRPDSTIISGQIKNNVPFRICGRFVDREPSRIMLGNDSAYKLPNIKGRFMVTEDDLYETQCFYYKGNKHRHINDNNYQQLENQQEIIQIEPINDNAKQIEHISMIDEITETINNKKSNYETELQNLSKDELELLKHEIESSKREADSQKPSVLKEQSKQIKDFEFDFSEFLD